MSPHAMLFGKLSAAHQGLVGIADFVSAGPFSHQ